MLSLSHPVNSILLEKLEKTKMDEQSNIQKDQIRDSSSLCSLRAWDTIVMAISWHTEQGRVGQRASAYSAQSCLRVSAPGEASSVMWDRVREAQAVQREISTAQTSFPLKVEIQHYMWGQVSQCYASGE